MSRNDLPLLGLLGDVIATGETRTFAPPAITPLAISSLEPGARVAAVTVGSNVELPSFVAGRWAAVCRVVTKNEDSIELAAEGRVRLLSAHGGDGVFRAEIENASDTTPPAELVRAAHALVAAIDAGAMPLAPGREGALAAAIGSLIRALADVELAKTLPEAPIGESVDKLARALAARAPGEHAACAIEKMLRELESTPELSKAARQRLWSAVVEIMRRLDVYDPNEGEDADGIVKLQRKLMQAGLPKVVRDIARRELRLLRAMRGDHHDYSSYVAHLEFIAELPWHPDPIPPVDLARVAEVLEREHAGLDKPKRRILEYLAVRGLGGGGGTTILCLVGPPGVGKTTLARAMAEALGRKFVRVALGGVHDECEIRGFRKSFVAASAGRLLTGISQAKSTSAVVLLDEIDKLGTDRARSPAGALHEVLDPEQNPHFQDNYLGAPYDLSHVLFVCTANDASAIPPTLLDRLEVIELDGYTSQEKRGIAQKHLLPRLAKEHGLSPDVGIADDAFYALVEGHTREAGVRQLSRSVAAIMRARALALFRAVGTSDESAARVRAAEPIARAEVDEALGAPRFVKAERLEALPVGVATGLSVGADGGSVLFIEAGAIPGNGRLRMTGRLGDVLRESAQAALHHLRMDPARYGIADDALSRDFHVHVPEGAVPKDGPSAGVALAVAFASAARGVPVHAGTAFTGEITLTGRVLPVGGVRAKVLAAERAGLERVFIPKGSELDVPVEPGVEIIVVSQLDEVMRAVFADGASPKSRVNGQSTSGSARSADARPAKRASAVARRGRGR